MDVLMHAAMLKRQTRSASRHAREKRNALRCVTGTIDFEAQAESNFILSTDQASVSDYASDSQDAASDCKYKPNLLIANEKNIHTTPIRKSSTPLIASCTAEMDAYGVIPNSESDVHDRTSLASSTRKRILFSPPRTCVMENVTSEKHCTLELYGQMPDDQVPYSQSELICTSQTVDLMTNETHTEQNEILENQLETAMEDNWAHTQSDRNRTVESQDSIDSEEQYPLSEDVQDGTEKSSTCFSSSSEIGFSSTGSIEDVGLFNCEIDVEYTGEVYGQGTDGTVVAAKIGGRKVALKRAKAHDGFSSLEVKHRSAVELHYLRKVRNTPGFVQCLGVCDGIRHTCIALEVMNGKLSEYLRKNGERKRGFNAPRRYILSHKTTKMMLKQICLPMITLHEDLKIAHGDLACRNILIRTPPKGYEHNWKPILKLSDFGRVKTRQDEPKIFHNAFSFYQNVDIGCFAREILYRLLIGEVIPAAHMETKSIQKQTQDVIVNSLPDNAQEALGPFRSLFMKCTAWGVRPTFREIYDHLDDLAYFDTIETCCFPIDSARLQQLSRKEQLCFSSPTIEKISGKKRNTPTHPFDTPSTVTPRPTRISVLNNAKWIKTHTSKFRNQMTDTSHQNKSAVTKVAPLSATRPSRRSLQILNKISLQHLEKEKNIKI